MKSVFVNIPVIDIKKQAFLINYIRIAYKDGSHVENINMIVFLFMQGCYDTLLLCYPM